MQKQIEESDRDKERQKQREIVIDRNRYRERHTMRETERQRQREIERQRETETETETERERERKIVHKIKFCKLNNFYLMLRYLIAHVKSHVFTFLTYKLTFLPYRCKLAGENVHKK